MYFKFKVPQQDVLVLNLKGSAECLLKGVVLHEEHVKSNLEMHT